MVQVRKGLDDEDKILFVNVFANANLPWPIEGCWRDEGLAPSMSPYSASG